MSFLVGLLVGIIICIPPGPITLAITHFTLRHQTRPALAIATGGSIMDVIYFWMVAEGMNEFALLNQTHQRSPYSTIISASTLILIGLWAIISKPKSHSLASNMHDQQSWWSGLLIGAGLYISNPSLIVTISMIVWMIKNHQWWPDTPIDRMILAIGVGLGGICWFLLLIQIIQKLKSRISLSTEKKIQQMAGLLLISLGIIYLIKSRI